MNLIIGCREAIHFYSWQVCRNKIAKRAAADPSADWDKGESAAGSIPPIVHDSSSDDVLEKPLVAFSARSFEQV